jgi:hypothetical protein
VKHSDAVAREAQALRAEGASYSEIAKVLGLRNGKSAVQGLLKRTLEPLPPPPPEPPSFARIAALPPINRGCQWIEGDVQDTWTWCGKPLERPGSAWCKEHFRRVYAKRGAGKEDAA